MICYQLACSKGHSFEAWFRDSRAYTREEKAQRVECPICGNTRVEKALMAPGVASHRNREIDGPQPRTDSERLTGAIQELRKRVEAEATDVGRKFPEEAQRMHDGEIETKPIYGEANLAEIGTLCQNGVPCLPLPWSPRRVD